MKWYFMLCIYAISACFHLSRYIHLVTYKETRDMNYDRRNEVNFYKKLSIILGTILAIIVVGWGVIFYFDQWNLHGVSNMPNFDWTKDRSLDLVGKVEGKNVYKYGISEMSYQTFSANKITAKEYYEQSWVTVDMLTASGLETSREGHRTYQYDCYYILLTDNAVVFCSNDVPIEEVVQSLGK